MPPGRSYGQLAVIALAGIALLSGLALADTPPPRQWLDRMSDAVQGTNYEGTVVRVRNGKTEALKVVHLIENGVIHEKIIAQEGDGVEIIRNGNEVHCILPERRSVLVEEWDNQSTLFSTLPSSDVSFGSEYDVAIVREERVAGRSAVLLAIRPHDGYRYGHRIWLDTETAFPLQTQLISETGDAIELVKFADIEFDSDIQASALAPSYSTDTFTWIDHPRHAPTLSVESDWRADDLPPGFKVVSVHAEEMPGNDELVTHLLYSDGIANVSVFIAAQTGANIGGKSKFGSANSFSIASGDRVVTAVGEVPARTVEQIARSMRYE